MTFGEFYSTLKDGERFTLYNGECCYTMAKPITAYLLKKYKNVNIRYFEQIPQTYKSKGEFYIELDTHLKKE